MNRSALAFLWALAVPVMAEEPPALAGFQQRAAEIFRPEALVGPHTPFHDACDALLLVAQGVAALLIVGGLIWRVRSPEQQLEGIASSLIKVAFIATVPFWQTTLIQSADLAAAAAGYRPATQRPEPALVTRCWALAAQWSPPSSPQMDALDEGTVGGMPESGHEEDWARDSWNWARGISAVTSSSFDWMWQTTTGGIRAVVVFGACVSSALAVILAVCATYLLELMRPFVFAAGCAAAPVFIAALAVDSLRSFAVRALMALGGVASWPIGWGMLQLVAEPLTSAMTEWLRDTVATALQLPVTSTNLPVIATAAPSLAWGILFTAVALTWVVAFLAIATAVGVPLVCQRLAAAGALVVSHRISVSAPAPALIAAGGAGAVTRVAVASRGDAGCGPVVTGSGPHRMFDPAPIPSARYQVGSAAVVLENRMRNTEAGRN